MVRKCKTYGCGKGAIYGRYGEKAHHCGSHRKDGEVNVVNKKCEVLGCPRQPYFSSPGESPKRCSGHKIDGDIDVKTKRCESPGCPKLPSFAKPGESRKRCSGHRLEGDIDVVTKRCEVPGCPKVPSFAQPGESKKRCFGHKTDGDIDVVSKTCEVGGCPKQPVFGQSGTSPKRCGGHRIDGDVNVVSKTCEVPGCPTQPSFAQPGESKKRCFGHKIDGDIDVVSRTCEADGCPIQPAFGQPGELPKRCSGHVIEGDVDVKNKRCSSCVWLELHERGLASCLNPSTGLKDMCFNCHIRVYPGLNTRITVSKEQFVIAEIQRQIPEMEPYFITWDCALPGQDCTRKKPDIVWGVKDTLIHVEIDENGEKHEDDMERIVSIHVASGRLYHVLIRFNPDKTSDGDPPCLKKIHLYNGDRAYNKHISEWDRRIPVLIESVRRAFNEALENKIVSTGKRKLFF